MTGPTWNWPTSIPRWLERRLDWVCGPAACWYGDASRMGKQTFFTIWCRHGTLMDMLVHVEVRRWAIEDALETAKTELDLDHNETRSWHGWHLYVSLVMLAFALLAVVRHKADALATPPKTVRKKPWFAGRCRRSVVLPIV